MSQLKCTECGQIFDKNLTECPNCACPASECVIIEKQQTERLTPSEDNNVDKEKLGYVDVDSDNVFVGIFRWLYPQNISMPYNSKPTKVTVAVDNDSEDVFEIEKSLFYILEAFTLKVLVVFFIFYLLAGLIYGGIVYSVSRSVDSYSVAVPIMIIIAFVGVIFCIILSFMIILNIFRPYWSHIHVRLRELHIRHWRNVYRAIKEVK